MLVNDKNIEREKDIAKERDAAKEKLKKLFFAFEYSLFLFLKIRDEMIDEKRGGERRGQSIVVYCFTSK